MGLVLLLLFVLLPIVELTLLIKIGAWMGAGKTIALVLFTGVVGWWLAKREGLRTWNELRRELNEGKMPGDRIMDAVLILVAGIVLVTPGVLTDALGFSLLIPPVRAMIRRGLGAWIKARFVVVNFQNMQPKRPANDDFIDVEATPVDRDGIDSDSSRE